jgi:hypothetical protein
VVIFPHFVALAASRVKTGWVYWLTQGPYFFCLFSLF